MGSREMFPIPPKVSTIYGYTNASIDDGIRPCHVSTVATNIYVLYQQYCVFINTFFNVSINKIVVANAALAWGPGW